MISDIPRQPINVIASFNKDGKIMPLYFQIAEDGEKLIMKIIDFQEIKDDIKNDVHAVFKCKYEHYGIIQTVTLRFYSRNHTWYLE